MELKDFYKGQDVWLKSLDRRMQTNKDRIIPATVVSVGRKYVTVSTSVSSWSIQFDSTNEFREKTEYSPTYKLYLSKQDILDAEEKERLIHGFHKLFNLLIYPDHANRLSLNQLRKIKQIVDEDNIEDTD